MSQRVKTSTRIFVILLAILAIARHDLWLWDTNQFWLGLPAGLSYHVLFCLVLALLYAWAVQFAWPDQLDEEEQP